MRSKLVDEHDGLRTFALAFAKGDELPQTLERFAVDESVERASFEAIGAFDGVTLGYFDWERKEYKRIPLEEQVEVLSLVGNITRTEGEPAVHTHVVVGRSDATARGGHLLAGRVRPTLELFLTETPAELSKQEDPETGLALLL
jgi:predicted DNA-binding protein with PD1-like motif